MKMVKEGVNIRLTWNIEDDSDVEQARQIYLSLTKQGWLAAAQNEMNYFQRVLVFNSRVGELLFLPLTEGG